VAEKNVVVAEAAAYGSAPRPKAEKSSRPHTPMSSLCSARNRGAAIY
jgi:hypothetical protein